MCDEFEWLAWQHENEQRAEKEKTEKVKKQDKATTPTRTAEPGKQQEEPVPA